MACGSARGNRPLYPARANSCRPRQGRGFRGAANNYRVSPRVYFVGSIRPACAPDLGRRTRKAQDPRHLGIWRIREVGSGGKEQAFGDGECVDIPVLPLPLWQIDYFCLSIRRYEKTSPYI